MGACQWLLPYPLQQFIRIGGLQHLQQGVALGEFAPSVGCSEQMQIVVAQQHADAVP
ncbi:hypothetical protein D3C71_1952190 [compost metagenome]